MSSRKTLQIPLNRVEGDLEIRVEVEEGVVQNAWCSGTMYRGFEKILLGRDGRDGLLLTPRICGICGVSHLAAAARALEDLFGASIPPDALRWRNLALMTEKLQSDMRQGFLMFAADLAHPAYQQEPWFEEAVRRYVPFRGETVRQVIDETKKVIEIIAMIGGQWPHSSFIVPGGIVSVPGTNDLMQCALLLQSYRRWYEGRILGCSLERWFAVQSLDELEVWLEEEESHRQGELGFLLRLGRALGWEELGSGTEALLSFGDLPIPQGSQLVAAVNQNHLVPPGFACKGEYHPFEEEKINEHVAYSWFVDYPDGRHPSVGETRPYATGQESKKYSWAKAPRYGEYPAETGPLAEMIISRKPLFVDWWRQRGASVLVRQLARIVRTADLLPTMEMWLSEIRPDGPFYTPCAEVDEGEGVGLVGATRGALGHWLRLKEGRIAHYQVIPPTAWNASPRDSHGQRGPLEEALVGTPVPDLEHPMNLGHIVRSFDPCLVCTVHAVRPSRQDLCWTLRPGAEGRLER